MQEITLLMYTEVPWKKAYILWMVLILYTNVIIIIVKDVTNAKSIIFHRQNSRVLN